MSERDGIRECRLMVAGEFHDSALNEALVQRLYDTPYLRHPDAGTDGPRQFDVNSLECLGGLLDFALEDFANLDPTFNVLHLGPDEVRAVGSLHLAGFEMRAIDDVTVSGSGEEIRSVADYVADVTASTPGYRKPAAGSGDDEPMEPTGETAVAEAETEEFNAIPGPQPDSLPRRPECERRTHGTYEGIRSEDMEDYRKFREELEDDDSVDDSGGWGEEECE